MIAEYANGSLSKEYVYSGSQLLATIAGTTTTYHHPDHLSVRQNTNASGSGVGRQGHFPFGESWYSVNTTTKWQFTSYERDAESGNDYATARYHINRIGRFASPDPLAGSIADPQSLNRYAYVGNDPVDAIDPLGLLDEPTCIALGFPTCGGGGGGEDDGAGYNPDCPPDDPCPPDDERPPDDPDRFAICEQFPEICNPSVQPPPGETPLRGRDLGRFNKNRRKLLRDLMTRQDCIRFLQSIGIDPDALAFAIENQTPYNGVSSTISEANAGLVSADSINAQRSVAAFFSQNNGVNAVAEPNGLSVYYRPGNIFGTGSVAPETIAHEAIHNMTGWHDANMQVLFGVPVDSRNTRNLSDKLKKKGCGK